MAAICASASGAVSTRTVQRACTVGGVHYTVKYAYDENGPVFVSLQNPIGRLHWDCRVSVFRGTNQVGEPFSGVFTEQGCFEDVPKDMVARAMSHQKPGDILLSINQLGVPYAILTPTNHGWGTLVANRTAATNLWPITIDRNSMTQDLLPVPDDIVVPTNIWHPIILATNSLVDDFKPVRDGLNSYRRVYHNDDPPWWESRDGAVVTDTNIVRMINAWHKVKE